MFVVIKFLNGQKLILDCSTTTIERIRELQNNHNFQEIEYIKIR